jgi:hypothetical protein
MKKIAPLDYARTNIIKGNSKSADFPDICTLFKLLYPASQIAVQISGRIS